jgi:hypothetical protein
MSVDLGEGRSLVPNHYCLRHGFNGGQNLLRSWRLEGSTDATEWTVLRTHQDDDSLRCQAFSVAHWAIDGVEVAYRHFRVVQAGPNSSGDATLTLSGIELYGMLYGAETHATSSS